MGRASDRGPADDRPTASSVGHDGRGVERRVLAVLCLASFLAVVNFAAPSPFLPDIARDLGTSVPLLGQVTTVVSLVSAALGLVVGPLADRFGHRRLVVVGMVAAGANLLGTALAPSYPVLLALAVAGGLGDAVLFALPLAIAGTRFAGVARRRTLAWTSAALPFGVVGGVPLLAAVGADAGWRAALVGGGATTLGTVWLAAAWLPSPPVRGDGPFRVRSLAEAYRPLLDHRPLLALFAASGLRATCWDGMFANLGAFLADAFGFGPTQVGLAYMASGAGSILWGRHRPASRSPGRGPRRGPACRRLGTLGRRGRRSGEKVDRLDSHRVLPSHVRR